MQVCIKCLGSLVNSYLPGLRSIPRARRSLLDPHARCALAITRSGSGPDLPGVRHTMTGSDDARGPPLGGRARRSEARESSRAWRPADFPESVCCLLVLNTVTSTPQWIRQPVKPRLYVTVQFLSKGKDRL
jgi:hypothetical protein